MLYFGANVGTPVRTLFQSLFESFLSCRKLTVRRCEVVRCTTGHQLDRVVVRERLAEGEHHAFCPRCGEQVALPRADTPIELTRQQEADLADQRRAASHRSCFEQVLFRLKAYVTTWPTLGSPCCSPDGRMRASAQACTDSWSALPAPKGSSWWVRRNSSS